MSEIPAARKRAAAGNGSIPAGCPIEVAHDLLSGRWTLAIAFALLDGPLGFGALRGRIVGISGNLLAQRLRTLATAGVVAGGGGRSTPYRLTDWGLQLATVRAELERWVDTARCERDSDERFARADRIRTARGPSSG